MRSPFTAFSKQSSFPDLIWLREMDLIAVRLSFLMWKVYDSKQLSENMKCFISKLTNSSGHYKYYCTFSDNF